MTSANFAWYAATMIDTRREAERLMILEWDELYDVELEQWLRPPRRAHLAELITALIVQPFSPNRQIACELLSYLGEEELSMVAESARRTIGETSASPDAPDENGPDEVTGTASIAALFETMNSIESFAEDVLREIALLAPELVQDTALDDEPSESTPTESFAEAHHLAFDPASNESLDRGHAFGRRTHPTWRLDRSAAHSRGAFGTRSTDGAPLPECVRVMRLDDLSRIAPALGMDRLDVQVPSVVLSGFGRGFVEYGLDGTALRVRDVEGEEPWRRPIVSERDIDVVLTPGRFVQQTWGTSNGRMNLNRLFGTPAFIQGDETPKCPSCARSMTFVLQLERGIPCDDGDELLDEGMAYGFFCPRCRVAGWIFQMT